VAAPFGTPESEGPGAVRTQTDHLELAPGRRHEVATLHNTGAQPIWVSSHFPLGALNPALEVSLADPAGYRLDVPAGVAVRIDAGERKEVGVVGIEVTQ
jgi:urease subunit gamma/beta